MENDEVTAAWTTPLPLEARIQRLADDYNKRAGEAQQQFAAILYAALSADKKE